MCRKRPSFFNCGAIFEMDREEIVGVENFILLRTAFERAEIRRSVAPFADVKANVSYFEFAHDETLYEKVQGAWRVPQIELMIG